MDETALLNRSPPAGWARIELRWRPAAPPGPEGIWADERQLRVRMAGGALAVLDRGEGTLTWHGDRAAEDGRLAHPLFGAAGAVHAWWRGVEALHGGAFAGRDGAWAVLGDPEAGKSSVLAGLAAAGTPVLADDCVVVDGGCVLAGPRCIDVRLETADALGLGEAPARVREGSRRRLILEEVPAALPLRGVVILGWASESSVRRVPVADRLRRLAEHRWALLVPRRPERLLDLARLPVYELTRPSGWASFGPTLERLRALGAG